MAKIDVKIKEESEKGWVFGVTVGELGFEVEVEKSFWQKLTQGKKEPAELVRRSFDFLLAREPKESILRRFNLKQISDYFPEYEGEIALAGGLDVG